MGAILGALLVTILCSRKKRFFRARKWRFVSAREEYGSIFTKTPHLKNHLNWQSTSKFTTTDRHRHTAESPGVAIGHVLSNENSQAIEDESQTSRSTPVAFLERTSRPQLELRKTPRSEKFPISLEDNKKRETKPYQLRLL